MMEEPVSPFLYIWHKQENDEKVLLLFLFS